MRLYCAFEFHEAPDLKDECDEEHISCKFWFRPILKRIFFFFFFWCVDIHVGVGVKVIGIGFHACIMVVS